MQSQQHIEWQVEQVLLKFNDLVSRRDLAVLDEFAADALLVGSELGEMASGPTELLSFFEAIFSQPVRIRWRWDAIRATCAGDIAWFFAEGEAFAEGPNVENRAGYRLSGVLRWENERWRWQQFHGAEPGGGPA